MRRRFTLPGRCVVLALILTSLAGVLNPAGFSLAIADDVPNLDAHDRARRDFEDARFGLAFRWKVDSSVDRTKPDAEAETLPRRFNPTQFDPEAWVKVVKESGARYLTVTVKDSSGFCFYDSKLTHYDVVDASPFARDPLKPLADACRKHEVMLFLTYSLRDRHHPDNAPKGPKANWLAYIADYQGQIRELCSRYGPIGGIRFDGMEDAPDADWDLATTYRIIRQLQPGALIANHHHQPIRNGEDFQIFDLGLPDDDEAARVNASPWEVFVPLGRSQEDGALARLLVSAAGRGANLLLDVPLKADGSISPEASQRLTEVGRWLAQNGDSIYGTRRGPVVPQPWGVTTRKVGPGGSPLLYLHVLGAQEEVRLPGSALSFNARLLGTLSPLKLVQKGTHVIVEIPKADRSSIDTVVVLTPEIFDREIPASLRRR